MHSFVESFCSIKIIAQKHESTTEINGETRMFLFIFTIEMYEKAI